MSDEYEIDDGVYVETMGWQRAEVVSDRGIAALLINSFDYFPV